jgi:hypothetical protein
MKFSATLTSGCELEQPHDRAGTEWGQAFVLRFQHDLRLTGHFERSGRD